MPQSLQFIYRELAYAGHLQAIGAALVVYIASHFLGFPVATSLMFATYCVFQAIYYFDRYRDLEKDGATNQVRTRHLKTYSKRLPGMITGLLLIALIILVLYKAFATLLFLGIAAVLGLLYPVFFKRLTAFLPLFKNFYVASVFAVLVFLPNFYFHQPINLTATLLLLFGFIFVESLITQFILDIKDSKSDMENGLRTLLTNTDEKAAVWHVLILDFFIVIITSFLSINFGIANMFLPLILGTFIFNLFVMWAVAAKRKSGFVWASAKYIVWGVIVLVF